MRKNYLFWLILLLSLLICQPIQSKASDELQSKITTLSENLQKSNGKNRVELLLKRGEAYRLLGYYPDALADFEQALTLSKQEIKKQELVKDAKPHLELLEIAATQSLGYICFLLQDTKKAETLLRSAFEKSQRFTNLSANLSLSASCANYLGNVLAFDHRKEEAFEFYKKALDYLKKINDPILEATIHRNIASILSDKEIAFDHLGKAKDIALTVEKITRNKETIAEMARVLIDIAAEYEAKEPEPDGDALRYSLLDKALSTALNLNDQRLISLASGELGKLYESRGRVEDAIKLTEQAVSSAIMIQNHALLLHWEWQWGRLLKKESEQKKEIGHKNAIAAYKRALSHVASIRQDMQIIDNKGCISFKQTLFPIYSDLADMLLKESGVAKDKNEEQQLLKQAQQILENIKQSELRDYFKDPCIDAMKHEIQSLSPSTAVIYPAIFTDRLELLADIGGVLYRKTSNVQKGELEESVTKLAVNLRNSLFHEELGRKVYSWLIEPFQSLLDLQKIDTLVIVPDGVFRMIPVAAIWNGKEFIGEKYAVVTEPALTLLDPTPLPKGKRNTLLAGMSRPGTVVLELPPKIWNELSQAVNSNQNLLVASRKVRGLSIKQAKSGQNSISKNGAVANQINHTQVNLTKENPNTVEQIKLMLELPGVDKEIDTLSKSLTSQTLMNRDFLRERFSGEIQHQNYRIIHIASHGFFGGTPEENFIMTYDKLLNMNLLEQYIKPKQFADIPVELLTLSACQTAEGDDRSPLGLSGVALKSGARSVVGSLWPVSDTATQLLLSSFYKHLNSSDISKAKALQMAQLELIKTEEFNHPFYWSAFILVGNWL
ncbi:MAG: CHAT domain-containing protein [Desulfamplus sp.]|nr:CHAT domain-containing protein [Desulfamplus sp.]